MSGLEGLGIVANVIAVVDLSLKVISWCSKYAQDVKNSKDSRAQLLLATHKLHYQSEKLKCLLDDKRKRSKLQASTKLAHALGDGQFRLTELEILLSNRSRGSGMNWPLQKQEVESAIRNIEQSTEVIAQVLQIDMAGILVDLDDRAEAERQRNILDKLPCVTDAAFDSHAEEHNRRCLPGTRVGLLKEINDWINNPRAKTVFWLNGMAGTGKSTISRTLAQSLSKTHETERQLGASFFFKRGETDRGSMSKLVPTLAFQLAARYPVLATHIQQAIQHDPTIPGKMLRLQFKKLITEPLSQSSQGFPAEATVVIIIDALDECESDSDIKLIINLFSQSQVVQHPRPRIFLTSRPELPIRLGFNAVQGAYQNLILHDVAAPIIEQDIHLFLRHELTQIRWNWNSTVSKSRHLPVNWPGDDYIQLLTEKAIPLFIFAATVCRLLSGHKSRNPGTQLDRFIELQAGNTSSQMDATYRPVLNQLLAEEYSPGETEGIKQDFRRIVGSIVLLFSPLSSSTLSRLLGVRQDMIDDVLDNLHSVLNVPPSPEAPIRMLHLSFRDYLISPGYSQTNPFWVNEKQTARTLVKDCFRVMDGLKSDMCNMRHPATPRSSLKPDLINACLPPESQYACLYWVRHQESAAIVQGDVSAIYDFLKKHLFHWIEALTLMGRIWEVMGLIKTLRSTLAAESQQVSDAAELIDFLDDATMLLYRHTCLINDTPLQLYSSVLVFAPTNSIVRKILAPQTPPWITLLSGRAADWDSRLQALYVKHYPVVTAFSSDSKLLTSVSRYGQVRVWSTDTGECVEEVDIGLRVLTAAISSDGKRIAVSPFKVDDGCVRIIDIAAGGCVSVFGGLKSRSPSLKFSEDSTRILSASLDGQVTVWDRSTGSCLQRLLIKPPVDSWFDVQLSPLSTTVLLIDEDKRVYVWCLQTEKRIISTQVPGCRNRDNRREHVAFSCDDKLLAVISAKHNVQIWSLQEGACIWNLGGNESIVSCFLFSFDSSRIAILCDRRNLRIWDISSGECLSTQSTIDEYFRNALLSPQTDYIVSIYQISSQSTDGQFGLWDLKTGKGVVIAQTNLPRVKSLLFSPDGAVLVSVSENGSIQLRDWRRLLREHPKGNHIARAIKIMVSPPSVMRISWYGRVTRLSTNTGAAMHEFCIPVLPLHYVNDLHFSPDSTLFAAWPPKEFLELWNLINGHVVFQLKEKDAQFVLSSNSEIMATATGEYREICVWDWKSGKFNVRYVLGGFEAKIQPWAFSPDSKWLAGSVEAMGIVVWNLDTQKCVRMVPPTKASRGWVNYTVFSPDSAVVASHFLHGIAVWDVETGDCVGEVSDMCKLLALSPIGTFMACSDLDSIRIWNWKTGVCLARARNTPGPLKDLEFLPDNSGIRTQLGILTLPSEVLATSEPDAKPWQVPFAPLFGVRDQWFQYRGYDLVKLPAECFEKKVAVLDNLIALDGDLGETILVRFFEEELRRCLEAWA